MSPGSAISALPRAPSPGWPMSLFAGTGFFTQSAVLFPTSIEKNKKTEACSRDPQASSLLHGKGRHRRPFFTRGGGKPFWGVGGGAAGCKIAPQACTCHANPPGTIVPVPDEGLGRPGGAGAGCRGSAAQGGPPRPQRPDPVGQPLSHPSPHRFLGPWPRRPLGRGRALTSPYSPPFTCGSGAWRAVSARSQLVGSRPEVSRQHRP